MRKNTLPRRPPKGVAVPPGLKPFAFAIKRKGEHEMPSGSEGASNDSWLLVSSFDPSTPVYELPTTPFEQRALLECLIERLESGCSVKSRYIQMALGADAWEGLKDELKRLNPPMPDHIAAELKQYEARLEPADRLYALAERSHRSGFSIRRRRWPIRTKSLHTRAESAYEDAILYIKQAVVMHPGIVVWLDRPVNGDELDSDLSPEPDGVPRLITSKSQYAHTLKDKRRSLKISTLK